MKRRTRHGLVAGLIVVLSLGTTSATAEDTPTTLWAGFESGSAPSWTYHQGTRVAPEYARKGSYGAQAVATQDRAAYLKWSAPKVVQGRRHARIAGWFRIDLTTPNESVGLFTLKNDHGVNHFDLFRSPVTGRFQWDLYRQNTASSTMRAEVGTWYYIEALVDFGGSGGTTYTARVRINGVDQPSIRSYGQQGTTVRSAYFGENAAGKTNTRRYDSLVLVLADEPQAFSW